jgi:hypothetical protein
MNTVMAMINNGTKLDNIGAMRNASRLFYLYLECIQ